MKKTISCILIVIMMSTLIQTSTLAINTGASEASSIIKLGVDGIGGKYAEGAVVDYNNYTDYADGDKLLDNSKSNYSSYFKTHRMWYQGGIKPQAVEKSTGSGDYAIQILTGSSSAFPFGEKWEGTPESGENYAHGIKLFESKNGCVWKSAGTYVQEFDLWVNTNDDLLALRGMNLWGNAMSSSADTCYNWHILDEKGHIRGTEVDYPVKTWFSLKLAYTYPENTWKVYIKNTVDTANWTEVELPDGGAANSNSSQYYIDSNITSISFILAQLDGSGEDKAGFRLDNYSIYKEIEQEVEEPSVSISGVPNIGGKYAQGAFVDYNTYTDYADSSKVLDGSKDNYSLYFKTHRMWYQGGIKPQAVEKSTGSGDYAIQILTGNSSAFPFGETWEGTPGSGENYAHGIKLFESKNGCAWKSAGTYVQEFDLWVNTNDDLLALRGMNLWGNAMSSDADANYNWHILDEKGHIRGTEVDYPVKTWFSLKLAYTYPANIWKVYIKNTVDSTSWTEVELPDGGVANSSSSSDIIEDGITSISFILAQLDGSGEDKAGFRLDNYRIYKQIIGIKDMQVSSNSEEIKVVFENMTGIDWECKLAIAGYSTEGELRCLSYTDETILNNKNETSITKMLDKNGATKFKVMLLDKSDGITPLVPSLDK